MFRFFRELGRFQIFFESERKRILDVFFDYRFEGGNYEFWLGRCYLVVSVVKN